MVCSGCFDVSSNTIPTNEVKAGQNILNPNGYFWNGCISSKDGFQLAVFINWRDGTAYRVRIGTDNSLTKLDDKRASFRLG